MPPLRQTTATRTRYSSHCPMLYLAVLAADAKLAQVAEGAFKAAGKKVAQWTLGNNPVIGDAAVAVITVPPTDLTAEQLYHQSAELGRSLRALAPHLAFFILIDGRLRGPIDALTGGLMDALSCNAVIAPADPVHGRTIVGGRLHEGGTLVADRANLLGELLGEYAGPGHMHAVPVEAACENRASLRREIDRRFHDGAWLVVVDADTLECLANIACVWWGDAPGFILVGSQGLFGEVVQRLLTPC